MKKRRSSTIACAVLGLAGLSLASVLGGVRTAPHRLLLDELRDYSAGCGYLCCDEDGSWDKCSPVNDDCEDFYVYYGEDDDGFACKEEGGKCTVAPEGDYDAECEGTMWGGWCQYGIDGFCSWFRTGECETTTTRYINSTRTDCECTNRTVTENPNNGRATCTGTECAF